MDERLTRARAEYERAVFGGDGSGLPEAERALAGVEADLALARGRLRHAALLAGAGTPATESAQERDQFERAAELYRALADVRGEAEAEFCLGAYHQVVASDEAAARPHLERSLALARRADDPLTASYALRHLGIAAHRDGRLAEARDRLEESTTLRRVLAFWPGVAANLVGLAYLAAADRRPDDAHALLDEAADLAESSAAHAVMASVHEARAACT